jgi:hypothetical protein
MKCIWGAQLGKRTTYCGVRFSSNLPVRNGLLIESIDRLEPISPGLDKKSSVVGVPC